MGNYYVLYNLSFMPSSFGAKGGEGGWGAFPLKKLETPLNRNHDSVTKWSWNPVKRYSHRKYEDW